jgi:hypothetical protein
MNGKPHVGVMVMLCLVPVLVVLTLPALSVAIGDGTWFLVILVCPLAHVVMMRQMEASGLYIEGRGQQRQANKSVLKVEAVEDSQKTAIEESLLPVQVVNKLPVLVSNQRPDRPSAG